IEALVESVNFYHHPILMNSHSTGMVLLAFHGGMEDSKSDIDASQLKKDLNLCFLGRHVHVIGQHCLKNYERIIKMTLRDNDILLELKATLHLWNLAHRFDASSSFYECVSHSCMESFITNPNYKPGFHA
ncbi:hypothetical protein C0995_001338, partial [Termitomyces sp. Mi166